MRPYTFVGVVIAFTASFAAAPACADLYKWIDEKGVTNYSNEPPADSKTARKLAVVEDKISVYTPDQPLLRAVEAGRRSGSSNQEARIQALERQLDTERRARQYAAAAEAEAAQAAQQAAYEQCIADRRTDCDAVYAGYYPYVPAVAVVPLRHQRHKLVGPHLKPGTIAGNSTGGRGIIPGNSAGMNGYIPGNSAAVFVGNVSRPVRFDDDPPRRGFQKR